MFHILHLHRKYANHTYHSTCMINLLHSQYYQSILTILHKKGYICPIDLPRCIGFSPIAAILIRTAFTPAFAISYNSSFCSRLHKYANEVRPNRLQLRRFVSCASFLFGISIKPTHAQRVLSGSLIKWRRQKRP
jgi:hypothetical protein